MKQCLTPKVNDDKIRILKKSEDKEAYWEMSLSETNKCPVCGRSDLGYFEISPLCEWQDDYQRTHPDSGGCANNMSLNEARKAFREGRSIR